MPSIPNPLAEDLDHVLCRGADFWEELRDARIFITGGTGFFGKWLLESLAWVNVRLSLNARAVVLTRRPDAFRREMPHLANDAAIILHTGDVCTFDYPVGHFTHVIHAATPVGPAASASEAESLLDVIVQGTRHTLGFARRAGARRVLFTSSGAVYGPQPPGMTHLPEDYSGGPDPLDPRAAYGEGKRLAEQWCALHHHHYGLPVTVARGFAFVGPYLPRAAHFAVASFLRDALHGGPIRVSGDGSPRRSYLYAADLAVWLWAILLRGQPGRAYNIGSEAEVSVAELANKIARLASAQVEMATPLASGAPPQRYVPSTRRAREELGLDSWLDLDTALTRTWRWTSGLNLRPQGNMKRKR